MKSWNPFKWLWAVVLSIGALVAVFLAGRSSRRSKQLWKKAADINAEREEHSDEAEKARLRAVAHSHNAAAHIANGRARIKEAEHANHSVAEYARRINDRLRDD